MHACALGRTLTMPLKSTWNPGGTLKSLPAAAAFLAAAASAASAFLRACRTAISADFLSMGPASAFKHRFSL